MSRSPARRPPGRAAESAARSAVESTPPLNATQSGTSGNPGSRSESCSRSRSGPKVLLGALTEDPEGGDPPRARGAQLIARNRLERIEVFEQRRLEARRHRRRIAVRAAERLLDHLIDEAEPGQSIGGHVERLGRSFLLVLALPENRGAALRRDHGIRAVLQHQEAVADPDGERAAGAALARDDGNDRDAEHGHLEEVTGDRLALAALFGADPGVGALRINQRYERQSEALRQPHQPQSLAIALGLRHAVIAPHTLLRIAALLMADDHHRATVDASQPPHDRLVIGEHSIAVQLAELRAERSRVVQGVRTPGMTRELRDLPGSEARENAGRELPALGLQARDLLLDVDFGVGRDVPQLLDLGLELGNGLFEIQEGNRHAVLPRLS